MTPGDVEALADRLADGRATDADLRMASRLIVKALEMRSRYKAELRDLADACAAYRPLPRLTCSLETGSGRRCGCGPASLCDRCSVVVAMRSPTGGTTVRAPVRLGIVYDDEV